MGLKIKIVAGSDYDNSGVEVTGQIAPEIIRDLERETFGLQGRNLFEIMKAIYGQMPTETDLIESGSHLYSQNGWLDQQVKVNLSVESSRIVSIDQELQILETKAVKNEFPDRTIKATASLTTNVQNTTHSSWEKSLKVGIGQKITYEVGIQGTSIGGETSINFEAGWGATEGKSETVTVGTSSGVEYEVKPLERAIVELKAYKGKMKVEVVYNATLIGAGVANYRTPIHGHHYHIVSMNDIFKIQGPGFEKITEIIEIDHYSSSEITVRFDDGSASFDTSFIDA